MKKLILQFVFLSLISACAAPNVAPSAQSTVYFASGSNGSYSLKNIDSSEKKEFIPSGYKIIYWYQYDTYPDYLILQKDNQLFSYVVNSQKILKISDENSDLKQNEEVFVEPSITEKNKFFIEINKYDPNEEPGLGSPSPISTRSYFFDAKTNTITPATNVNAINLRSCHKYDSKYERFFSWPCGEGVGSQVPLSITDVNGKNAQEIVTMEDFNMRDYYSKVTYLNYNNGLFLISDSDLTKILVVDPKMQNPQKTIYTVDNAVSSKVDEAYTYSKWIDTDNKTIVFGGSDFILFFKYNAQNQITEMKYFPDEAIYANFIFPYDGKIIYQSKNDLKIINLATWDVEKTIPLDRTRQEITLIRMSQ